MGLGFTGRGAVLVFDAALLGRAVLRADFVAGAFFSGCSAGAGGGGITKRTGSTFQITPPSTDLYSCRDVAANKMRSLSGNPTIAFRWTPLRLRAAGV